jgi:hypothetical protein
MGRVDATYYRKRAEECREAAAKSADDERKGHWQEAEGHWLFLAELAETVAEAAERNGKENGPRKEP